MITLSASKRFTMNQEDIESGLLELFSIVLEHPVTSAVARENEARWDSLKHMQLVFSVEEKFQVQFTEEEIPTLDSFSKFLEHLRRHHVA
jgi:acyl carrier protein